ncbi:MAG: hypothetical protein AB7S41_02730 [Parvibaculaceae bacterium]
MNWIFNDYADVYDVAMLGSWRGERRNELRREQDLGDAGTDASCEAKPPGPKATLHAFARLTALRDAMNSISSAMRRLSASAPS